MISEGRDDARSATAGTPWRRGLEVFDDYAGGGVLSEELADDLVNDLLGLVGGSRPRRVARAAAVGLRPDSPCRPAAAPAGRRPRLTLVRGSATGE
jgi:hypothetical protein